MSATTAAVPFWRAAGMTYIGYSNVCAALVRRCLKEPYKSEAASREKVHFSITKWTDGKQEKPIVRTDDEECDPFYVFYYWVIVLRTQGRGIAL
ncbi:hypothetical protein GUJ93_ZPchr0008g13873 [Zizania palustris]|uniref:ATP synthase subunit epsilon, mitochondrial n=1 Tax=Zizania palustris TaxID=103762 RepID=A0A8J5VJN8_ZIZPA|nr:hypothetical protein GUJ93_ZPchr0008g13873 [Zizania palustris]